MDSKIRAELEEAVLPHVIHPTLMDKLVVRVSEMVQTGRATKLEDLFYDADGAMITPPVESWDEWVDGD